jgi:hypothetical protein
VANTPKARRRGNSARRAEETRSCLEQRLKSRSYPEIAMASATEFGRKLSQTVVIRQVQDGIEGLVKEPAEQARAMEHGGWTKWGSAVCRVWDSQLRMCPAARSS